jgi:hypothetical protein
MSIRGTDINKVPLEFVRVQPYVSPKIELSNERQEQVDLRVLPVIFRFEKKDAPVYPGQLVDVYIGRNSARPTRQCASHSNAMNKVRSMQATPLAGQGEAP